MPWAARAQDLPAYVVLSDPTGLPVLGVDNWTCGWLPSLYQGTVVRSQEPRILNLDPPPSITPRAQERFLNYLQQLNRRASGRAARRDRSGGPHRQLSSWPRKMQTAAKEALDISQETAETHRLYGIDQPETKVWGARCLIARRLVERGVRFVQIPCGNQHWDHHGGIEKSLPLRCKQTDQPTAALVQGSASSAACSTRRSSTGAARWAACRSMQNEKNIGRDHNTYGFSVWLAGGGLKAGYVHGATDEFGHKAVENVVNHYDYHATLLHLFGLDQEKATFQRASGLGSLIDGQPARVVHELLA